MSGVPGPLESRACHVLSSKDSKQNNLLSVVFRISYDSPFRVYGRDTAGIYNETGMSQSLYPFAHCLSQVRMFLSLHLCSPCTHWLSQALILQSFLFSLLLYTLRQQDSHIMSHGGRPGPEPSESSRGSMLSPSESRVTSTLGTTQSSRLTSSSRVPSTGTSNQETLPSPAAGQVSVLKILEEITESFRGGKSSKTEAVASILRVIGENN